jgi:hypothetical protein
MKLRIYFYLVFSFLLMFLQLEVFAQQNIINIPASDIVPSGEILLKETNDFWPFNPDEFVSLTPAVTVGIPYNINLTGGVGTSISDKTKVRARVGYKQVFIISEPLRFTIDSRLNPNLQSASTPSNITYAHFAAKIKKTRTQVIAGMYIANDKDFLPDKPGVVLGLEQGFPVDNLKLAVEWTSRNESYGLLGVGFKYKFTPTFSITNAVLIPNGDKGNWAFRISLSKYLNTK